MCVFALCPRLDNLRGCVLGCCWLGRVVRRRGRGVLVVLRLRTRSTQEEASTISETLYHKYYGNMWFVLLRLLAAAGCVVLASMGAAGWQVVGRIPSVPLPCFACGLRQGRFRLPTFVHPALQFTTTPTSNQGGGASAKGCCGVYLISSISATLVWAAASTPLNNKSIPAPASEQERTRCRPQ